MTALVAVQLLLAYRFWFVCDDAYITYRYARNWSHGLGLVFNPGEVPPVEGYSDFLWLLLAAATERLGWPTDLVLPGISALAGALLVQRVYAVATGALALARIPSFLGALLASSSPILGVWSTSGLETMPQALLTFLLFEELVLRRARDWPVGFLWALGLALLRTEGLGWVGVVAGASVLAALRDGVPVGQHLRRLAQVLGPLIAAVGLYHLWRFQYYGTLVPNTALVKVSTTSYTLARGARYVALLVATTLVPVLPLAAVASPRLRDTGALLAAALVALAFPVYAVVVGGDFMPFGRLLVPGLPFAALLAADVFQETLRRFGEGATTALGAVAVVVGLLPVVDVHLTPLAVRAALHFRLSDKEYLSEFNRWDNQRENSEGFMFRGLALDQVAEPGDAVVAAAVGAIGYYSSLTILDQHGLVTKEVAYRPAPTGPLTESPGHDKHVDPTYFLRYRPRFLYARAVWGRIAAGKMKDTMDLWEIDPIVTNRYVPDFHEVTLPGVEGRAFLLVIRRLEAGEDPAELWNKFPERRRALNAELRAEYAEAGDADAAEEAAGHDEPL